MMKPRSWILQCAAILLLGGFIAWLYGAQSPAQSTIQRAKGNAPSASPLLLAGTASCSARGCHGGIEPNKDPDDALRCHQNEYSRWAQDPHAGAYRTLFNVRSVQIATLLGEGKKAHEDQRCLACHVNPQLVQAAPNELVEEEKHFGVGCESCHGQASGWLVAHTARDWRAKKNTLAMPDLADAVVQAKACVGCHVGAPSRDVNHDMIAAGHPRLTFEFATYRSNLPAHWRTSKKSEGHLWAVGQIVSAEAALELLVHRAEAGPWPEFAEYNCFSCHHALSEPGWRQTADPARRDLGALRWGTWYFGLLRPLAGELPELDRLEREMQERQPDRCLVIERARGVLAQLKAVENKLAGVKNKSGDGLARLRFLDRFFGGNLAVDRSWEGTEQAYLALQALSPSPALDKLAKERAFPPGFQSPDSRTSQGAQPFDPQVFLEKLRRLPKQ